MAAFVGRDDESVAAFRLRVGAADDAAALDDAPVFAGLMRGDLVVPAGTLVWALLPGSTTATVAAIDLLA